MYIHVYSLKKNQTWVMCADNNCPIGDAPKVCQVTRDEKLLQTSKNSTIH